MPYRDPDDLYYVWRDYGAIADLKRGMLAGTDIVEFSPTVEYGRTMEVVAQNLATQGA